MYSAEGTAIRHSNKMLHLLYPLETTYKKHRADQCMAIFGALGSNLHHIISHPDQGFMKFLSFPPQKCQDNAFSLLQPAKSTPHAASGQINGILDLCFASKSVHCLLTQYPSTHVKDTIMFCQQLQELQTVPSLIFS